MPMCKHCGRDVVFEHDGGQDICPECGWSQAIPAASAKRAYISGNTPRGNRLGVLSGVVLIALGIISVGSVIGLVDIYLGVGLVRMKKRTARSTAVTWQELQLVVGALGFVMMIILVSQHGILTETIAYYLVTVPVGLLVHTIVLVLLNRPSVRGAYDAIQK